MRHRPARRMHPAFAALTVALLALGHAGTSYAEEEMAAFGVNTFGDDENECGETTTQVFPVIGEIEYETPGDLAFCDDWTQIMVDEFNGEGWGQTTKRVDSAVDGRDWIDVAKRPRGEDVNDPYGTDFADVTMLCSHGGHLHEPAYHSRFMMGDDEEACYPDTVEHILFGDVAGPGDLEVAILGTCESAQHDVFTNQGYFELRERDGTFNTWLGFHGVSYDSDKDTRRFEDFVAHSFDSGLGDNWIDEMYRDPSGSDPNDEQCPAAVIFCDSSCSSDPLNNCDDQYEWGGFEDRFEVPASEAKNWSCMYFLSGCDPGGGSALP